MSDRVIASSAIKGGFQSSKLSGIDLSGIDGDASSRLMASHIDGGSGELPAKGNSIGGVIDSLISTLGRRSGSIVNQMNFIL